MGGMDELVSRHLLGFGIEISFRSPRSSYTEQAPQALIMRSVYLCFWTTLCIAAGVTSKIVR